MSVREATMAGRPSAATNSSLRPRILIICDHTRLARALEHHVSIVWDAAECRVYSPQTSGHLHSAFTALGFDAVLLDDAVDGGRGMDWLDNLLHRPGFPPILYFAPVSSDELTQSLLLRGVADCLASDKIDNRRLDEVLRNAVLRRRQDLALQRLGSRGHEEAQFGDVRITGHRFVRQLAAGGSSMIYLAESERAGDMVVLKVLREAADGRDADKQFARFLQEYEVISTIRHPNVVRIHDLGLADDHAFIAMEYFSRGDLRAQIAQLTEPHAALGLLLQITHALEVVHQVGVLHRDLKPGNIMLRGDGSLALIDFGLARQFNSTGETTGIGQIFGTPYYMSPEQGHGQTLDARSDLYSLGVIFHEMLVHRKPYVAPTPMGVIYQHANGPLPVLEGTLRPYQSLLNGMLAKDPNDRFGSAAELAAAIEVLMKQGPT
jgi:tRNA A-37 threonylcarbamoyl transferase component Bud32/DNA-binding response OmpR family regulator